MFQQNISKFTILYLYENHIFFNDFITWDFIFLPRWSMGQLICNWVKIFGRPKVNWNYINSWKWIGIYVVPNHFCSPKTLNSISHEPAISLCFHTREKVKLLKMKNLNFLIDKIFQILKHFSRTFHWAQTSYFLRVYTSLK